MRFILSWKQNFQQNEINSNESWSIQVIQIFPKLLPQIFHSKTVQKFPRPA